MLRRIPRTLAGSTRQLGYLKKLNQASALRLVQNQLSKQNVSKASCFRCFSSQTGLIPVAQYEEIKELPKHPEKILIDVREPKELEETGKIPTSINIPLSLVGTTLSPEANAKQFLKKYGREMPTLNTEVIFTCKLGKRAQDAAEVAAGLGYKNVKNYKGSWTDWAEHEGLPK